MDQFLEPAIVVPNQSQIRKRIAFLGQPNTGKSTFFNRLTKANSAIANWPGLTVDLLQAVVTWEGVGVECVDLPGIYDLKGFSEDEAVVQRFLEGYGINLVVVVVNGTQIDRQLRLVLQIRALGLPMVVLLNLADEAKRYGVTFDRLGLQEKLGVPLYPLSAKYGTGCGQAIAAIKTQLHQSDTAYRIPNLMAQLQAHPVTQRAIDEILEHTVQMPAVTLRTLTNAIDGVMLHPLWGLPIFFASMLGVFWLIWMVGLPSADPVDWLTGQTQRLILEPLVSPLPEVMQRLLLDGAWGGFAALLSFLPLVALFFAVMGFLEGSGYFGRAAYLMDGLMGRFGLDGRCFVLQMMGFGCNVPAIMGTRTIRSRSLRLLAMLIIPFSLCSARLQVFVFILAAVLPGSQGAIALFGLYLLSFGAALVLAGVLSRFAYFQHRDPFVLELPPYRLPSVGQIALRVWGEMREFLTRLSLFMIFGSSLVWVLTSFPEGSQGLDTWAGQLGQIFHPLMEPLGFNPFLTVSLIFGFVAKEIQVAALAVSYGASESAIAQELAQNINPIQGFSYCLFSLLYMPCLTTLGAIWNESKSSVYTAIAVVLPLLTAWLASFCFYQGAQLFLP